MVSLLEKMREQISNLKIEIDADLTEEHPKVAFEIRLVYRISGKE